MRHLKSGRALGVKPPHRKAMLRNLVTSLLEHQRIKTTVARAKELRTPLDKMVTLGKKGDLNSRRQALAYVKTKKAMQSLFGEYAERYADREGGFTRILQIGPRKGDGALLALVILVDGPEDPFAGTDKPKKSGKPKKKVSDAVAEKISEDKAAKAAEAKAETEEAPAEAAAENAEAIAEASGEATAEVGGKATEEKAEAEEASTDGEEGSPKEEPK